MTGRVIFFACRIRSFEKRFEYVWSVHFTDSDTTINNLERHLVHAVVIRIDLVVTADANAITVL